MCVVQPKCMYRMCGEVALEGEGVCSFHLAELNKLRPVNDIAGVDDPPEKGLSDKEIVDKANQLAAQFYLAMGYDIRIEQPDFKFYKEEHRPLHPTEKLCWELARIAFEELRDTDIQDALDNLEGEE